MTGLEAIKELKDLRIRASGEVALVNYLEIKYMLDTIERELERLYKIEKAFKIYQYKVYVGTTPAYKIYNENVYIADRKTVQPTRYMFCEDRCTEEEYVFLKELEKEYVNNDN